MLRDTVTASIRPTRLYETSHRKIPPNGNKNNRRDDKYNMKPIGILYLKQILYSKTDKRKNLLLLRLIRVNNDKSSNGKPRRNIMEPNLKPAKLKTTQNNFSQSKYRPLCPTRDSEHGKLVLPKKSAAKTRSESTTYLLSSSLASYLVCYALPTRHPAITIRLIVQRRPDSASTRPTDLPEPPCFVPLTTVAPPSQKNLLSTEKSVGPPQRSPLPARRRHQ